jgi:hypothetical protein
VLERLRRFSYLRRLVMGMVKRERNQLYGAIETIEGLGTTLERVKRI